MGAWSHRERMLICSQQVDGMPSYLSYKLRATGNPVLGGTTHTRSFSTPQQLLTTGRPFSFRFDFRLLRIGDLGAP